ncbi:peptide ABC transporter substrate-binding protein [Actomonas aquatica]|uniref:Peptide ABC transporter substrate-binding protein n=1 Tax=Actomonas aquatica TaxID=2866162 RepID=A0ABZ1C5Q3_9BACT|nr:peptide ABC transporter substrate-binding protein [Opitutus sp. WL0086]WRQ87073.1 peptide ABC transporter substrate-binding protein [Opitutus sp. WL0086]
MRIRSSLLLGAVALTGALLLAGCGKRETPVDIGNREQIFHLGNLSEPTDLDPQIISSLQDFQIVIGLFEGLTSYNPSTAEPVPGVATHWESSADAKTWTFHLRPEAKWSNGDPVTAHDFVWSYQRVLSPALGSEYAAMLFCLKNARDYLSGEVDDFSEVGVKALDDHTLQLSLDYPVPYLPGMVAHAVWYPIHRDTILAHGDFAQRGTRWTRPGNLVGNGPFVLTEWIPNQIITLSRNELYWDNANVILNQVNFYPIENSATEEAAFRSGQLHATVTIPQAKIAVYKNDPERSHLLKQYPQLATYFYRLNVDRPPLNDPRVRRALSMTVNRQQIIDAVARGGQMPAFSLTPPDTAGYTPPKVINYDPEAARALLAEAGFPGGEGFPKMELLYNTSDGHRALAEALQQMWRKELGIDIGLYNQEAKVWNDTMREKNYDIARYAWVGDYLDASTFLDLMTSENGNNQTNWSNAAYDELIERSRSTIDKAARFELYRQAEAILMEDSPIVPLYYYTNNQLQRPELKGFEGNLLDIHPLNRVYLEASQ